MRHLLTLAVLMLLAAQLAPASLPSAPRQAIQLDAPDDAVFDCAKRFLDRQPGEQLVHTLLDQDRVLGRRLRWTAATALDERDFARLQADLRACERLAATP